MLGIICLILDGLIIEFNKTICLNLNVKSEFKVGLMMEIIIISFLVGNSAFGVNSISYRRVSHLVEYIMILI